MLGRNVDSIVEWKTIHKCSSTDTVSFRFAPCRRPPSYGKHQKHRGQERARKHRESLAQAKPMPLAAAPAPPAPRPPINRSLGFAPGFAPSNFADQADHAEAEPAQDPPPPPPYDDSFMSASLSPPPLPSHDESSVSASPSPPPSSDDSAVLGSPSPPDSPRIICSQYRQTQHDEASAASPAREEPPTFITIQESVSDRRRLHKLGQAPMFKRDSGLQLYVRADHRNPEGQAPLCYVATGYQGDPAPNGEPHQGYMVYNESDLRWARRLNFHLRRLQARAK